MWYQHWGLTDGYQYFQPGWMDIVRSHGSIPLVTWDPWIPPQGPNQPNEPVYALQNIINGNFDSYITKWARDSKAWGHPYFLRFAHEMNGNWNPWSEMVNGNKPGQFVLAWRHVHDIFVAQGVTNVSWVWCPNIDYSGSEPLKELYPGDAYVDWVGMDGYNWGTVENHTWQNFQPLFQQTYQDILSITSKPLMIAETASTEQAGNKANWITDAYTQLPHYFPLIRAIVWFDQDKETDWSIESSPAAQNAFASAIQSPIYTSNNYANLNTSPIPPL
jgi:beta-mannanase